jgi:hypothetical protein
MRVEKYRCFLGTTRENCCFLNTQNAEDKHQSGAVLSPPGHKKSCITIFLELPRGSAACPLSQQTPIPNFSREKLIAPALLFSCVLLLALVLDKIKLTIPVQTRFLLNHFSSLPPSFLSGAPCNVRTYPCHPIAHHSHFQPHAHSPALP